MEIRVYLTTGKIARFGVSGEFGPQRTLGEIDPRNVFSKPLIEFSYGSGERRIFNPECVEVIALITELQPEWAPPPPIKSVEVISRDLYREITQINAVNEEAQSRMVPGMAFGGLAKVTLKSGNQLFLMHTIEKQAHYDQRAREEKLFTSKALPIRREGGGAALLNTANVASWKFIDIGADAPDEGSVSFQRIGDSA